MKNNFIALLVSGVVLSCGEAGLGFDVGADFPVEVDVPIDIPTTPEGLEDLELNPPSETVTYGLTDVPEFQDILDEVRENEAQVFLSNLSYEMSNIGTDEEVPLDALTVSIEFGGSSPIEFPLSNDGRLRNISKRSVEDLSSEDLRTLSNALLTPGRELVAEIEFDLGDVNSFSGSDIDFTFTMFFDALVRVEDIID